MREKKGKERTHLETGVEHVSPFERWLLCAAHRCCIQAQQAFVSLRQPMRLFATVALLASLSCGCSQQEEMPPEVRACAAKLYANYNPKNLDQCTAVCIACANGVMTTCSTACTLKGAK
jgi:hypothetical protein